MAVRPWWSRTSVIGVGVLLAAALGAWQASRVADALGFGPRALSEERGAPAPGRGRPAGRPPSPPPVGAGRTALASTPAGPGERTLREEPERPDPTPAPAGAAPAPGDTTTPVGPQGEAEQEAAERLAGEMRRLVQDLEFTPGLPEPKQQTVVPAPAPWQPAPEAGTAPPPVVDEVAPRRARTAGGTQVVLRGRHLRVAQVMFGTAAARITQASEAAVTVEVPPGRAGQVVIAVTNTDGTWVLAPQRFTYAD